MRNVSLNCIDIQQVHIHESTIQPQFGCDGILAVVLKSCPIFANIVASSQSRQKIVDVI